MKFSIIIVSLALAVVVSANQCQRKQQKCGKAFWNGKTNNKGRSINIIEDSWSDISEKVQEEIKSGHMENVVAAVNVKKNIASLLPNLESEEMQELVKSMLEAGSVGAILEAYVANPVGFDTMLKKMDDSTTMDINLIVGFYENVGDFFGTRDPIELAKKFPRTREQLVVQSVKFGLMMQFPDSSAKLENDIIDVIPFIQGIFTEAGNKYPKFKKVSQLINMGIDVTGKLTGGKAFRPLAKFIDKLNDSYDDEQIDGEEKE